MPIPDETDTILRIDAYAMLPFPITFKCFEMIPGRHAEIFEPVRRLDHHQFSERDALNGLRQFLGKLLMIDPVRFLVRKTLDHDFIIHERQVYINQA